MRLSLAATLLALSSAASAAAQWGFTDGSVTVASKGGNEVTEKYEASRADTLPHRMRPRPALQLLQCR